MPNPCYGIVLFFVGWLKNKIEMEYGKIKVGDVVKFNAKAKKEIASAIDNREHIVEKVDIYSDGTEYVDFEDGTLIDDAVEQALRLANQLQVIVQFKFNGIKMRVKPKSDENEIIETYLDKHRSKADEKEY